MTRLNDAQLAALRGLTLNDWYITDQTDDNTIIFKYESAPNCTGFIDMFGRLQVHYDFPVVNYMHSVLEVVMNMIA